MDSEERLDAGGVSSSVFLVISDVWVAVLSKHLREIDRDLDLAWPWGRLGDR